MISVFWMNSAVTVKIKVHCVGQCFGFCSMVEECKGMVEPRRGCCLQEIGAMYDGVQRWQTLKFPSIEETQICVRCLTIFKCWQKHNCSCLRVLLCFLFWVPRPARCDAQARAKRGDFDQKTSVRPQHSVVLSRPGLFFLCVCVSIFFPTCRGSLEWLYDSFGNPALGCG